jgi:hypothetical protein
LRDYANTPYKDDSLNSATNRLSEGDTFVTTVASLMPGKSCLIRFKQSNLTTDLVFASSAEIHGEHLVFLHADGSLAAMFLLEVVESWSEIEF